MRVFILSLLFFGFAANSHASNASPTVLFLKCTATLDQSGCDNCLPVEKKVILSGQLPHVVFQMDGISYDFKSESFNIELQELPSTGNYEHYLSFKSGRKEGEYTIHQFGSEDGEVWEIKSCIPQEVKSGV